MKKSEKKEDIYNIYLQNIERNYLIQRRKSFLLGVLFIPIALYLFHNVSPIDISNYSTFGRMLLFIPTGCILLSIGLYAFCVALFDPQDHQSKKKEKDIDILRFEYEQYLERKKIIENHSGGELIMEWPSDSRFKFE